MLFTPGDGHQCLKISMDTMNVDISAHKNVNQDMDQHRDDLKGIASILQHIFIKVLRDREPEMLVLVPGSGPDNYWVTVRRESKKAVELVSPDLVVSENEVQLGLLFPPDVDKIG